MRVPVLFSRLPILLSAVSVVLAVGVRGNAQTLPMIGTMSTVAGNGVSGTGGDGGLATSASLGVAESVAVDPSGNLLIADASYHRIRRVSSATGIITTAIGTGVIGFSGDGGPATAAQLNAPIGVATASNGDIYIAEYGNHRIRKVTAATGIITTVAGTGTAGFSGDGGAATAAQLANPSGVAVDSAGNLYIADTTNNRVRKVTAATGVITTLAGTGTATYNGDGLVATSANLNAPRAVAVSSFGFVYIVEFYGQRVRVVSQASGALFTAIGNGLVGYDGEGVVASSTRISYPLGVAVDAANDVYVTEGHRVRKLSIGTGLLTTVAGTGTMGFGGDGGLATAAQLSGSSGLTVDAAGAIYICDKNNFRVRKVSPPAGTLRLTTVGGTGSSGFNSDGIATSVNVYYPSSTATTASGDLYFTDWYNHRIRKITPGGVISTIVGTGVGGYAGDGGLATGARLNYPTSIAVDPSGQIYVADTYNHRIRRINISGYISTIAGTGVAGSSGDGGAATSAQFTYPRGIALDGAGNLYIADTSNHRIRKITVATGIITTVAGTGVSGSTGDGGAATSALLNSPNGVAVNSAGTIIYISDSGNHRVRKVASGVITNYAGTGTSGYLGEYSPATAARLYNPRNLALDAAGHLYIADSTNNRIRRVDAGSGFITTVAGNGEATFGGDGYAATAGQIQDPYGVSIDTAGNLWIADTTNHRLRKASMPYGPPANVTLTRYGSGVLLNWTPAAGATSYNVKRSLTSGSETTYANVGTTSAFIPGSVGSRYFFVITALYGGTESAASSEKSIVIAPAAARGNVDGDVYSDALIYRPSGGYWYSRNSSAGYAVGVGNWSFQWGAPGDIPVPADFDGDGKNDPTVYRPSTGQWFVLYSGRSYDPAQYGYFFGGTSTTTPMAADFDGDGKSDIALYEPSTGYWSVLYSTYNYVPGYGKWLIQWGGAGGDLPKPADYDADGKADIAIYRTGNWFILYSSLAYEPALYGYYAWGTTGDTSLAGDFDGDGRSDIGVYRPSTGYWYLRLSSQNYVAGAGNWIFQWGSSGDVPKISDFDGDGIADITVYRPSAGVWFILYSTRSWNPAQYGAISWGAGGDVSLP